MTPEEEVLDVLLVEDNPGDATLIETYLDRIDPAMLPATVELNHVESRQAAIEAIREQSPGLVLLDLGLPESTGIDTLTAVLDAVESVPVVVLTGLDDQQTAIEAIQAGAQDYLNKDSIDRETLGRTIRYAIERTKRERELRDRTRQLEVLTRIVRHDVANDIVVIRGMAKQLRETAALSDDHRTQLDRIVDASAHVTELIDTTRDFVDSIVGDDDVELCRVAVDDVLVEEVRKVRATYDDATITVDDDLPSATVLADEMLSSVFRNLLNNAVQHNHGDDPRVWVRFQSGPKTVRVTVADDGPGVPESVREEVFGKGEKGIDSEGSGIGLHLVYTLVDRYDGDVWVDDSDAGGAAFHVELPTVE